MNMVAAKALDGLVRVGRVVPHQWLVVTTTFVGVLEGKKIEELGLNL